MRNGEDEAVTMGTFHMRSGDATVTLWSGVDVDEYPTLTITLQKEGAGPESSGEVYLRGSIEPWGPARTAPPRRSTIGGG